jgi:phenylpropionate dioxygenase-like ring-hydroxylating dioxygenase large terminal subunit
MLPNQMTARDMVSTQSGEISRALFASEELYKREQERIFARAWLYVGHESQVPNPGDYVLSRMGEESVIMTRDRDGEVRVLLNSCRHRGMRVCRYDEGKTDRFFCPYHGWSYDLTGALKVVTKYSEEYREPFDKSEWGLIPVAQLTSYRGTIWATWDKTAPPFEEYMGSAMRMLDLAFRAWDGSDEIELLGSVQKWIIPSNWKIVSENFAGDMLHLCSHASVDLVGIGPNKKAGRRDSHGRSELACYPEGHAGVYHIRELDDPRHEYGGSEATARYFQECFEKRKKVMGNDAWVNLGVGTIFPNMSFHGNQPRTILTAHPAGVNKTEMWRSYFVDKNAPPEVKEYLRHYYIRYSGPAGMTEQDDMENWNYATSASEGVIARQHPYNYMAGLGRDRQSDMFPGATMSATQSSEQNARILYDRWAEMMDAETWSQLRGAVAVHAVDA